MADTKFQSAAGAAATVASLASQIVLSVVPALGADSPFSAHLDRPLKLQNNRSEELNWTSGTAKIAPITASADPLSHLLSASNQKRASLLSTSDILIPGVSHLYKLASRPVVLHVAVTSSPDYAHITAVRQSGALFLHSETVQETVDLAITAHSLAIQTGKAVVHFFNNSATQVEPNQDQAVALLKQLQLDLDVSRDPSYLSTKADLLYSNVETNNLARPNSVQATVDQVKLGGDDVPLSSANSVSTQPSTVASTGPTDPSAKDAPTGATSVDQLAIPNSFTSDDVFDVVTKIWAVIYKLTGRQYQPFDLIGRDSPQIGILLFGNSDLFSSALSEGPAEFENVAVIKIRLYRPWLGNAFAQQLPSSLKRIAVLEQEIGSTTRWGPLLLDTITSVQRLTVVGYRVKTVTPSTAGQAIRSILDNIQQDKPVQNLSIGVDSLPPTDSSIAVSRAEAPQIENSYYKVLNQLFPSHLWLVNGTQTPDSKHQTHSHSSPEYALGSLFARLDAEESLYSKVKDTLLKAKISGPLATLLSDWAVQRRENPNDRSPASAGLYNSISALLPDLPTEFKRDFFDKNYLFKSESRWIVGSDSWAYDVGNSGVHHLLASGKNINMLIIDNTPQPTPGGEAFQTERRKKDIGLYAMNFGNAYVASVAVYSSYTQLLDSLLEADKFNGPSIVLAYLPYTSESESPISVLQETKRAVESGYWPLYRWNPLADEEKGESPFRLDSERLREGHKSFLDRQNHLTRVMKQSPILEASLKSDFGSEVRAVQKKKAKDAYVRLLDSLAGAPLTVLFASDNGNAEGLAKRLSRRAKARGLKSFSLAMDDYPFEDLASEQNVALIASTAGQGEFPQNARNFWESIKSATDLDLSSVKFSVFGLGDSHYWPRKEDRAYYNKPAKDLYARLLALGAQPLNEIGLGDDQDPDGYHTGYQSWEPTVWQALNVANVEGLPDEPAPLTMEDIKVQSNFLRGTIKEGLLDDSTGAIAESDQMLTKFHGTYMQDDRDLREQRKADGLEPAYSFMIRCRLPSGVATPQQWVQMDDIANQLGNKTMKLTTRQTFQFHGVVKGKLKPAMQAINRSLMTTLAACGDVNRNVMCSSLPEQSGLHKQVHQVATKISNHLLPSTSAYHEIWLTDEKEGKTQVGGNALVDFEPLYGPTYLPRKFKITIAVPPHNDTDVYAHDIGLIAIKDAVGRLKGFNVLIGGGMGATHNNKKTYPQIGRMIGFCAPELAHIVCEKIMLVQRDNGDRKNRKHARLKYTVDDLGVDVFKSKVEELLGWKLSEPEPFQFTSNTDSFGGWLKDENGNNHFTVFIENGRVEDSPKQKAKTGLRELATILKGAAEFRLTANQHLIVSNVSNEDLPSVQTVLAKYGLDNTAFSGLRLSSSACVAFPTCGLAMAESERYLPQLIDKLEGTIEETGLRHDSIVMRMTGCPNGCARPWLAEIGLVGKAYGVYNLYLGGGHHGNRLGKLYRSNVPQDEIVPLLKPLLWGYSRDRIDEDEPFGDYVVRAGVVQKTVEGRDFHLNIAEEDDSDE